MTSRPRPHRGKSRRSKPRTLKRRHIHPICVERDRTASQPAASRRSHSVNKTETDCKSGLEAEASWLSSLARLAERISPLDSKSKKR